MRTARLSAVVIFVLCAGTSGCLQVGASRSVAEYDAGPVAFDAGPATPDAGPSYADAGCSVPCGAVCCALTELCRNGHCEVVDVPNCAGRECGPDGIGGSCGECDLGMRCLADQGRCVPDCETDAELCAAYGAECGMFSATDRCNIARTVNCGDYCPGDLVCLPGLNRCGIEEVPETDEMLCVRLGVECGPLVAVDNFGTVRSIPSCGSCIAPANCTAAGRCACAGESDADLCDARGAHCGPLTAIDRCNTARSVATCGSCGPDEQCVSGNCTCRPELDAVLCAAAQAACGPLDARDRCGNARRVATCGSCGLQQACVNHACCLQESDVMFCRSRCGPVTAADNCGVMRTVQDCRCPPDTTCRADGQCIPWQSNDGCSGPEPLVFDPATGMATVVGDLDWASDDAQGSCLAWSARDLVYSVTLSSPMAIDAVATRIGSGTSYPLPALYLRSTCARADSELACAINTSTMSSCIGEVATLRTTVLATGTYWLWVDGSGEFALTVTEHTVAPPPMIGRCQTAAPIDLTSGAAHVQVDLSSPTAAGSEYSGGCIATPGPEQFVAISLSTPSFITATVPAASQCSPLRTALYLRNSCSTSAPATAELACAVGTGFRAQLHSPRLDAGTYYVFIDTLAPNQTGTLTADITRTPAPAANDTCATATPITLVPSPTPMTLTVETTGATDDASLSCAGMTGPDIVYRIDMQTAGFTATLARASGSSLIPALQLRRDCGATSPLVCATGSATATASVTYSPLGCKEMSPYLVIDGSALSSGVGVLTLTPIPAPAVDTCCGDEMVLTFGSNSTAVAQGSTTSSWYARQSYTYPSAAHDVSYSFVSSFATPRTLQVTVTPAAGSLARHSAYVTNSWCEMLPPYVGGAVAAAGGAPVSFSVSSLAAGNYYVIVDGATAADEGAFTLTVTLAP